MIQSKCDIIERKLEDIIEKLHEQTIILSKNTESLIVHEKRTDLAERKLDLLAAQINELRNKEIEKFAELEGEINNKLTKLNDQMTPIKVHVDSVEKVIAIFFKYIIPCFVGLLALMYKIGWLSIK